MVKNSNKNNPKALRNAQKLSSLILCLFSVLKLENLKENAVTFFLFPKRGFSNPNQQNQWLKSKQKSISIIYLDQYSIRCRSTPRFTDVTKFIMQNLKLILINKVSYWYYTRFLVYIYILINIFLYNFSKSAKRKLLLFCSCELFAIYKSLAWHVSNILF